jgi:hypothetical protein
MQAPSGKKSHPRSLSVNERSSFSCIRTKTWLQQIRFEGSYMFCGVLGSTIFLLKECNISSTYSGSARYGSNASS